METTTPAPALEAAAELVRASYAGKNHQAVPTVGAKALRGSSLVRETATEYARRLISGEDLDIDSYWGYLGNTLADGAFARLPSREIVFKLPLWDDWVLGGHADAMFHRDGGVVMCEHKFANNPNDDAKLELAFRQPTLYLALADLLAQQAFQRGESQCVFPSEFPERGYAPFTWLPHYHPAGIVTAIAPPRPPPKVITKPLTPENLAEVREMYLTKAKCITDAADTGDLAHAQAWDDSDVGRLEFARNLADLQSGPRELQSLLPEYHNLTEMVGELERQKAKLKAEILNTLEHTGLKHAEAKGFAVTMISKRNADRGDVKALLAAGLRQYVIPGGTTTYPQVRRVDQAEA